MTANSTRSAWYAAIVALDTATEAARAYQFGEYAAVMAPPEDKRDIEAIGRAEAEWGKLLSARTDAQIAILTTPAPDIAALADKLALTRDEDAHEYTDISVIWDALAEDADRLAGEDYRIAWDIVRAAYEAAYARYAALGADFDDAALDAVGDHVFPIEQALINTPAPDVAAIGVKLSIIMSEHRMPSPFERSAIFADIHRMTGEA